MGFYICIVAFILICVMLVGIILIQSSKSGMGAGMAGNTALNSPACGNDTEPVIYGSPAT